MAIDPEILRHKEWLGFLQPVGLVVSPPALVKAQAIVNRNVVDLQQALLSVISRDLQLVDDDRAWIFDFPAFMVNVLGWESSDLVSGDALQDLEVVLPDYGETLAPTYAVQGAPGEASQNTSDWLMLVQVIVPGADLDQVDAVHEKMGKWAASPQAKFERLLRETGIPFGLLCNGTEIRLVYAPKGESSGHLTFPVQAMCEVSGRLILGAMDMLLSAYRVFTANPGRRLTNLLEESRKHQVEVSTALANQVVDALWELLRGFQMADAAVNGRLLSELANREPQHIYGGLITTLMRLVFLLYAEDEGLMPPDDLYQHNYSVSGLFEHLRADAGNYPDTMDQRYGAWAWLLSLFRLVYDGGGETSEYLPARHGQLFDPDEYTFLEGRSQGTHFTLGEPIEPPRIPDGVVYRLLERLLMLNGERLSYRSLEVEQIGSVYESIMGYAVERAGGVSIAVRPQHVVVNLEALLAEKPGDRAKRLQEWSACKVTGKPLNELKTAKTAVDMVAALGRRISPRTPNLLPAGSLYLQPGEERRKQGLHYTPPSLVVSTVQTALEPVLKGLGDNPTAEQILSLRVCDIAMGSGAFLVGVCRLLADKVEEAWNYHGDQPKQASEDPLSYARFLVAENCLYGVDKNPFAIDLAKLSLWLFTLARDHEFTFLDHALKCGDSLVGFTKQDYQTFISASDIADAPLVNMWKEQRAKAKLHLENIRILGIGQHSEKEETQFLAQKELIESRLISKLGLLEYLLHIEKWQKKSERNIVESGLSGNAALAGFLSGCTIKERKSNQKFLSAALQLWQAIGERSEIEKIETVVDETTKDFKAFDWLSNFPQVFDDRENSGFDCIIGNPAFAGKNTIIRSNAENYLDWLKERYPESHGNSDLVAYFFRRAFDLLRQGGTFGLVATNTIAQGDTRSTGLRWICEQGGTIYNARKRVKWVGHAAVVVSVIHIYKGLYKEAKVLDGKEVPFISAFLFPKGGNNNPNTLLTNAGKSFVGSYVLGMGFTFDDTNEDSTSIAEMHRLIKNNPRNQERVFPYIGGEEVNSSPTHAHHRYVINFGDMNEAEAREYPDLMAIVEEKVKPKRLLDKREIYRRNWWQFCEKRVSLYKTISECDRVLVRSLTSKHFCFTFLDKGFVYDQTLIVFALPQFPTFTTLSSRIHEVWANFFGASLEDRPRYNIGDCFETFSFPENWEVDANLEAIGKRYYEFRAGLMVRNNEGLTQTYNRFHDPSEFDPAILQLRQLHEEMDRAVLDAYGWNDLQPQCEFLLDYEDEEEDDDESTAKRQRKKPYRYRWNETIHDEVLARLLALNQERYEQELLGGKQAGKNGKGQKAKGKTTKNTLETPTLPGFKA